MTLKDKIKSGQKIAGTMFRLVRNPAIGYLAKNGGLDFFMLDCEHGHYDFQTIHDIFTGANSLGVGGFIRVPRCGREYVSRALDAGATGVMVPMTETPEQAELLVKYAKYQPLGDRGFNGVGPHTDFKGGKHAEVMEQANNKVIAIAQIETRLAIENVNDIAAVEGIDALLVGPNDLSIALGIPGDMTNPIELEAIAKVAAACKKHGKAMGLHAGAALLEKFGPDLNIVMNLSDNDFLMQGFASVRKLCDSLSAAK